jgi:hypothetical protein
VEGCACRNRNRPRANSFPDYDNEYDNGIQWHYDQHAEEESRHKAERELGDTAAGFALK